jgi:hypothetical protein
MGKSEREKGKLGEREAAKLFSDLFGVDMRRSQQFCGRSDEADDIIGCPGVSVEVKRRNKVNLSAAVEQAVAEAAEGNAAIVLHRADRKPWLVSCRLEDLPDLVTKLFHVLAHKNL